MSAQRTANRAPLAQASCDGQVGRAHDCGCRQALTGSMIWSVLGACVQDGGGAQDFRFRIAGNQLQGWRITVM